MNTNAIISIYKNDNISRPLKDMLAYLAHRADKFGACFPSYTTIAKDRGIDRRTAVRQIAKLCKAGYISRNSAADTGKKSNTYRLNFKQIAQKIIKATDYFIPLADKKTFDLPSDIFSGATSDIFQSGDILPLALGAKDTQLVTFCPYQWWHFAPLSIHLNIHGSTTYLNIQKNKERESPQNYVTIYNDVTKNHAAICAPLALGSPSLFSSLNNPIVSKVNNEHIVIPRDQALPEKTAVMDGCESEFIPPQLTDIKRYITERQYSFDAETFFNYHAACGWMIRGVPVRNWKALAAVWQKRERVTDADIAATASKHISTVIDESDYSDGESIYSEPRDRNDSATSEVIPQAIYDSLRNQTELLNIELAKQQAQLIEGHANELR